MEGLVEYIYDFKISLLHFVDLLKKEKLFTRFVQVRLLFS